MLEPLHSKSLLYKELQQGAICITPNKRLAQHYQQCYAKASGLRVLSRPHCLSYMAFLNYLYQEQIAAEPAAAHPLLLNAQQLRWLWQTSLAADAPRSKGLVTELQDAWSQCQYFEQSLEQLLFAQSETCLYLQKQGKAVEQQLKAISAIATEQIVPYCLGFENPIKAKSIIWACFDDFQPQQRRLQGYFQAAGLKQYCYEPQSEQQASYCFAAETAEAEYQAMLSWAQKKLAEGARKIALIVPDLEKEAKGLGRLLKSQLNAADYDLSLGQPLNQYPLIAQALEWLQLGQSNLSQFQARTLLQSPYLAGSETEFLARAKALEKLALLQEAEIPWLEFIAALKADCPILAKILQGLSPLPRQGSTLDWQQSFKLRLNQLGFPGEAALNSANYQYYQRFVLLLDEFLALGLIQQRLDRAEAYNAISGLAEQSLFQIQKPESPIQVLGLLEAAGIEYEAIWLCHMTDLQYPAKTRLSAFIPQQLQKEQKMQRALAERELALAEKNIQRLQNSSVELICSYPKLRGDEPNLPSPLIHSFSPYPESIPAIPNKSLRLEQQQESYQVPLVADEKLRGGTALLADQAKCPFRAFAAHRLQLRSGPKPSDGLNPMERGNLIHQILEAFWNEVGSQAQLIALEATALQALLEKTILKCLERYSPKHPYSFPKVLQQLEVQRLSQLVHAQLDWERSRDSFSIQGLEQSYSLKLAGLEFQIRVDRLDQVGDAKWVIDYKSSLPSPKPWQEERPEEPQLLLYALLDPSITALIFVELKAGKVQAAGFSEKVIELPGIKSIAEDESWQDYQSVWKQRLSELAEECQSGHCPPSPKRSSICQSCDFGSLCRIDLLA